MTAELLNSIQITGVIEIRFRRDYTDTIVDAVLWFRLDKGTDARWVDADDVFVTYRRGTMNKGTM